MQAKVCKSHAEERLLQRQLRLSKTWEGAVSLIYANSLASQLRCSFSRPEFRKQLREVFGMRLCQTRVTSHVIIDIKTSQRVFLTQPGTNHPRSRIASPVTPSSGASANVDKNASMGCSIRSARWTITAAGSGSLPSRRCLVSTMQR